MYLTYCVYTLNIIKEKCHCSDSTICLQHQHNAECTYTKNRGVLVQNAVFIIIGHFYMTYFD